MNTKAPSSALTSLGAWLALLRPPNLLTVPGDVVAGYLLAGGAGIALVSGELAAVAGASLLFYAAGLLLNDWADVRVDQMERPERPLPAGRVSRGKVFAVAALMLGFALAICFWLGPDLFLAGLGLAAAIGSYNLLTKQFPVIGPLNMGLCRGLNFLLGAFLIAERTALPDLAWWGLACLVGYITAVTHIARREVNGRYFAMERWLPAMVLVAAFFAYLFLSELIDWPGQLALALFFLLAAAGSSRVARALPDRQGNPADPAIGMNLPTPALVGRLISLLLPLQAAFMVGSGDGRGPLVAGLIVFALWPLKLWLGRLFYSS